MPAAERRRSAGRRRSGRGCVPSPSSETAVAPALGDQLELAVAVELVAEEVAEADGPGADAARAPPGSAPSSTSSRPSSAPPAARSVEATPETRLAPGVVVREPKARPEDLGRHRRGRRLAVRRRDRRPTPAGSRAASRSIAPGSSFESSLPGTVIPAPAPEQPRERGDAARSGYLGGETHRSSVCDDGGTSIE